MSNATTDPCCSSCLFFMPISIQKDELLKDQQHMDNAEHGGNSLADMGVRAMGQLPYMQQVQVVSNYQNFSNALKTKLASIRNERGDGALVTEADIKDFMAGLERKK